MTNAIANDAELLILNIDRTLNEFAAEPRNGAARSIMLARVTQLASEIVAHKFLPPDVKDAAIIVAGVADAEMAPVIPDVTPARPGPKAGKPWDPKYQS